MAESCLRDQSQVQRKQVCTAFLKVLIEAAWKTKVHFIKLSQGLTSGF